MNWPGPILTDSGGFQVMSLKELRKLDETASPSARTSTASQHRLTPERSIEIQHLLDADITMSFDECTSFPAEEPAAAFDAALHALGRARPPGLRRAARLRPVRHRAGQHLPELRAESAKALVGHRLRRLRDRRPRRRRRPGG
jgi:queuine tRNA-ribosyltransferase